MKYADESILVPDPHGSAGRPGTSRDVPSSHKTSRTCDAVARSRATQSHVRDVPALSGTSRHSAWLAENSWLRVAPAPIRLV